MTNITKSRTPKKVVAYLRVSTEEQADSGLGLAAQLDACSRWADQRELSLSSTFEDDISGGTGLEKRTGLLNAIANLGRADVLIVAKRDRLGRDPIVTAMVERAVTRKGARIVSAAGEGTEGDSPADILMRRMIDAFAEYERLIIGARTKAALNAKIRRRERVGKIRFGFDLHQNGVNLIENDAEQQIIQLIHQLHGQGQSLRRIAAELTNRHVPTKDGNSQWKHSAVARILARGDSPTPADPPTNRRESA